MINMNTVAWDYSTEFRDIFEMIIHSKVPPIWDIWDVIEKLILTVLGIEWKEYVLVPDHFLEFSEIFAEKLLIFTCDFYLYVYVMLYVFNGKPCFDPRTKYATMEYSWGKISAVHFYAFGFYGVMWRCMVYAVIWWWEVWLMMNDVTLWCLMWYDGVWCRIMMYGVILWLVRPWYIEWFDDVWCGMVVRMEWYDNVWCCMVVYGAKLWQIEWHDDWPRNLVFKQSTRFRILFFRRFGVFRHHIFCRRVKTPGYCFNNICPSMGSEGYRNVESLLFAPLFLSLIHLYSLNVYRHLFFTNLAHYTRSSLISTRLMYLKFSINVTLPFFSNSIWTTSSRGKIRQMSMNICQHNLSAFASMKKKSFHIPKLNKFRNKMTKIDLKQKKKKHEIYNNSEQQTQGISC